MKVTFWGVRGSIPTPGPDTVKYGGNTPCIEIEMDEDSYIIVDAGSGIRELGLKIVNEKKYKNINIMISHTHWDHIQGLPFFVPIFIGGFEVNIFGPLHHDKGIKEIIEMMMKYEFFPVTVAELAADVNYTTLKEETFQIGNATVISHFMNHPVFMLGYRIEYKGKSVVYTGDNEPYYDFIYNDTIDEGALREREEIDKIINLCNLRTVEFVKNSDLLVCDAQYTEEEYNKRKGWGHSSMKQALELALKANVKQLALFHHDPQRSDGELEQIEKRLQEEVLKRGNNTLKVSAAKEKCSVIL